MRKVLMISYLFPPLGGVGVLRALKYIKYMREFGYEPVVLTADENTFGLKDPGMLSEVPEGVKIYRTASHNVMNFWPTLKKTGIGLQKGASFIYKKLLIPDGQVLWQKYARKKALEIIKKENIDLIYSTSYPYSSHLLAMWLKEKTGVKWVADFRDEWTNNPHAKDNLHSIIRNNIEKKMEKNVLDNADKIIVITDYMKNNFVKLQNISEDKFSVIPNGYDEQDFDGLKAKIGRNERMTFIYTGSIYGSRSPENFFNALHSLISSGDIDKQKIHIEFIGSIDKNQFDSMTEKYDIQECCSLIPHYVGHRDIMQKLMDSDVQLLIVGSAPGAETIYTGKVFEYIRSGRPVFSLAPYGGVVDELIRKTGTGWNAADDDIKGIKNVLKEIYDQWISGCIEIHPIQSEIKKYDRRSLTEMLTGIMNSL